MKLYQKFWATNEKALGVEQPNLVHVIEDDSADTEKGKVTNTE